MRIFVAVFPSLAAREAATRVVERLRRPQDDVVWVGCRNLHYTLRFMGKLEDDGVARVIAATQAGSAEHPAFPASLGEPGAFPEPCRARVLWLGAATGGDALVALAGSLERALGARGFPRSGRAFTPHLTLGRVRRGEADWSGRLAALAAAPGREGAPSFVVDRVSVVHSTLSPGGSVYRVRAEAPLAG